MCNWISPQLATRQNGVQRKRREDEEDKLLIGGGNPYPLPVSKAVSHSLSLPAPFLSSFDDDVSLYVWAFTASQRRAESVGQCINLLYSSLERTQLCGATFWNAGGDQKERGDFSSSSFSSFMAFSLTQRLEEHPLSSLLCSCTERTKEQQQGQQGAESNSERTDCMRLPLCMCCMREKFHAGYTTTQHQRIQQFSRDTHIR